MAATRVIETANIMFDARVKRGVTMGKTIQLSKELPQPQPSVQSELQKAKAKKQHLLKTGQIRPSVKPISQLHDEVVVEKVRVPVPLHLYLEEQREETVRHEEHTQTDALMERPPSPIYRPKKRGVDLGIQVDNEEVFNFDRDIQPLLEVLVGKVLDQSLMEVKEESELLIIQDKTENLEIKAASEEDEAQQREQHAKQQHEAKVAVLQAKREEKQREALLTKKLISHHQAQHLLSGLTGSVMNALEDKWGLFSDPSRVEAETDFLPWLYEQVAEQIKYYRNARLLVDELLVTAHSKLETQKQEHIIALAERAAREAKERAEQEKAEAELARRTRKVKLMIHTNVVEDSPVGPIVLRADSTAADVEKKVIQWMESHMNEPPETQYIRFLWGGQDVDRTLPLHELGLECLSSIQMVYEPPAEEEEEEEGEDEEDEEEEDAAQPSAEADDDDY